MSASSSAPLAEPRRWTCQLCAQKRNTEDTDSCMTCGRPRGHKPEKYHQRLQEIRTWSAMADGGYSNVPDDEGGLSDSWGLILGVVMLLAIVALLVWAYIQDENEAASMLQQEL
mmetsp:Transcript_19765/g.45864  ORF Transcript_19765/g.45864 Transcript_19765/m.45864 type:complete len:114 (+) Transcript_19765:88-429(+)